MHPILIHVFKSHKIVVSLYYVCAFVLKSSLISSKPGLDSIYIISGELHDGHCIDLASLKFAAEFAKAPLSPRKMLFFFLLTASGDMVLRS